MAAVNVTNDAVTYNQTNGARVLVRNSAGTPYVVMTDEDATGITVWKGNSTTPTSFSEQDAGNAPASGTYGSVSAAIDSTDIIHIVYMELDGKTSACRYVTFDADGTTDTYAGDVDVDADLGSEPASLALLYTAIAVDSNDIPHIAYTRYEADMGSDWQTLTYNNRIGGAWNASGTEIEGSTANKNILHYDLVIDADNLPCVSYKNETDSAIGTAQGDANDPSSFTLNDVQTSNVNPGTAYQCAMTVDSNGDHWVAYRDSRSAVDIGLFQHQKADAWTTWQSVIPTNQGASIVQAGCMAADGTDIYIFNELEADNDIAYIKYDGSSSITTLETGTYNTAKAKWAFWVDNDSGGAITQLVLIDSYEGDNSQESSLSSADNDGVGQSFTGDGNTIDKVQFSVRRFGSPTGNITAKVYAHSGTFGTSSVPTGSALATSDAIDVSTIQDGALPSFLMFSFSSPLTTSNGTKYVVTIEYSGGDADNRINVSTDSTSPTHNGNASILNGGSWSASAIDVNFIIHSFSRDAASELDYTFADEVSGEEDILWNTLSIGEDVSTFQWRGIQPVRIEQNKVARPSGQLHGGRTTT